MTIKYKLAFTIDSETLFGIMSKFLPVQDLSVEEVPMEDRVNAKMQQLGAALGERQLKRADLPELLASIKPKRHRRVNKVNLYKGSNAIIMAALADGGHHPNTDIAPNMVKAGYATNGLYGRMERLRRHGYVMRPRAGYWQLTPAGKAAWDERPFPPLKVEDRA